MKKLIMAFAFLMAAIMPHQVLADVPLDCSGNDCGTAQIPDSGQPPASQAGTAPGQPIEAPSTPAKDPVAPVEPPPPGN